MARTKSKQAVESVNYNAFQFPPCVHWDIGVTIARQDVPHLLEQLHSIASEKQGASFCYPDVPKRMTKCRYEWNKRWKGQRFGLRLGLLLDVTDEDVSSVRGYVAQAAAVTNPELGPPDLSPALRQSLPKELIQTLVEAGQRSQLEAQRLRYVLFHVEMPPFLGVKRKTASHDKRITVFPTRVVQDEQGVSAVCISIEAASDQLAEAKSV